MQAITGQFGPSHLAFLVVPMVGAFFIDIANAIVIKLFSVAAALWLKADTTGNTSRNLVRPVAR
jgi:Na+/glutamate symporter